MVGQGAWGAVYYAWLKGHSDQKSFVLKVSGKEPVDKGLLQKEIRFYEEANAKLSCIPTMHANNPETETKDAPAMLVMSCTGLSLEHLRKKGIMTWDTVKQYAVQMIDIIKGISDIGWLHRDIHPGNIVDDGTGSNVLKIIDFGLSTEGSVIKGDFPTGDTDFMSVNSLRQFHRGRTGLKSFVVTAWDDLESIDRKSVV